MTIPYFSWLCEKIFNVEGKLPKNQKEYLSYLAINGVDVSLPNFDKDLNSISKDFYNDYINYFSEFYLKNMLEKNDYDKISDGVKIDPLKVQQYSRLISQNRGVFNDKSVTNFENINSIQIEPAFISSLNNFLIKLNIGWREIFFPKGLYFRYFKKN